MKAKIDKRWNKDVKRRIDDLEPVKDWLRGCVADNDTDWESRKSAHQALKLIEMAQYEMWNMQWWKDQKERALYLIAEDRVNGK